MSCFRLVTSGLAAVLCLCGIPPAHAAGAGTGERAANPLDGMTIGAVHVTGPADIEPAAYTAVTGAYIGRTLSGDDIQNLLRAISAIARDHGYAFASSAIPPQTLTAGILTIAVDEGRIDAVRTDQPAVARLLSPLIGKPGRQDELDRLLTLAGDFPGMTIGRARYVVEDGKGTLIVPASRDRVRASASLDNRGSKALGPVRALLGVDLAGLITADDRLTVQGVATPLDHSELGVVQLRYALVLPDAATELAVAVTYGRTDDGGRWQSFDPHGHSVRVNASATRTLQRSGRHSLWGTLDFNYAEVNQWWDGQRARRDRIASIGLSFNGYAPLANGRLRSGVELRQAMPVAGATAAGNPLASNDGIGSDYMLLRAWTNWVGDLHGPFSARLALNTQLATNPVATIDQISLGGGIYGRGYNYGERTGDQGIMTTGEIRADIIDRNDGPLRWFQLYAFGDAGLVTDLRDGYGTGDLYSAGAGARIKLGGHVGIEVEAALPIDTPRYDSGNRSARLTASIGTQF